MRAILKLLQNEKSNVVENETINQLYFMRTIFLLTFIAFTGFLYSQNVGIGTAIPAAKLEVQGDFRISGSPSNYVNFTLPASSQTTNYILPASTGTNGQFLQTDGTGTLSWGAINTTATDYLVAYERQPNNTAAGNATGGAFTQRNLNRAQTLSGTAISFDSVAHTITLNQAGTYHIRASAPAWQVSRHQLVVRNTVSNAILLTGTTQHSNNTNGTLNTSLLEGVITISGTTTIKLDHFFEGTSTVGTQGMGASSATASGLDGVFALCVVEKMQTTPVASSPSAWSDYLIVEEQVAASVDVPSVAGFQTRDLNTITASNGSSISCDLVGNTITLLPGTYHIVASGPAFNVAEHQMRLINTATLLPIALGQSSHSNNGGPSQTFSNVDCIITVGTNTTFKLEHHVTYTRTNGLGAGGGSGTNVFARCFVQKIQ